MSEPTVEDNASGDLIRLAGEIVTSYVGNNPLPITQISEVIQIVYGSLSQLGSRAPDVRLDAKSPAVAVKKSVTPDFIICLEDGKKLKMLKRHLRTTYDMTPEDYRAKWNLPTDYPMVAPNYAAQRSEFAKKIGLGRKSAASATPVRRGRRPKAK